MTRQRPSSSLVRQILIEECAGTEVTPAMVLSGDRRKAVSWVRSRVCKRLYEMGRFSFPGIGKAFNNLNHSSVWHAVHRDTGGEFPKLNPPRPCKISPRTKFLQESGWA